MRILQAVSIAIGMLVLSACSAVYSPRPLGKNDVYLKTSEWEGNWLLSTNPPSFMEVRVKDAAKGFLIVIWYHDRAHDVYAINLRESGDWTFANVLDDKSELFLWARIRRNEGQILIWCPKPEWFEKQIRAGKLPGALTEGGDVLLGSLQPEHLQIIASAEKDELDWENPIIATLVPTHR